MRRCRGVGMWEVNGMWDGKSDVCTGEAWVGHCSGRTSAKVPRILIYSGCRWTHCTGS